MIATAMVGEIVPDDHPVREEARSMRSRRLIVCALLAVCFLDIAGSQSARAASAPEGYQRTTVREAGISLLVPRGWKVRRGNGGPTGWLSAIDESRRLVSVGPSPAYGSSLPSLADVRAYLASLERATGEFERATVKRTKVANHPAVVQIVVVSEKGPKVVTYLFQARSGRVVAVSFGGSPGLHDDPEFDEMRDTMIRSVRRVPS
jgi:hypothetical protein